ncbi:MAG: hypothetical protein J6334_06280 [Kiritimatiellae bacterium]|nr:hypothetical protein [Kiritimatiellia bacterium]
MVRWLGGSSSAKATEDKWLEDPVPIREKLPLDRVRFGFKGSLVFGNGETFYDMVAKSVSESTRSSSAVKPIIATNTVSIYVPGTLGSIKTYPGSKMTFPTDWGVKTFDGLTGSVIDLDLPMRDNPSDVKREKDAQPSTKNPDESST